MNTVARPISIESSHFYTQDGKPLYQVEKKDGSGMRPFTLSDARKMNPRPLPSVTTILKTLHREALVQWRVEQACLSVLTAPRKEAEELDAFVERVLHEERQQDQEAKTAADLGTRIHKALEDELSGRVAEHEMLPWIEPVWEFLNGLGCKSCESEKIIVGDGYAGRVDLIQDLPDKRMVWDFKTTRKVPKTAYWEHQMQCAAYGWADCAHKTGNIYISTSNPGEFVVCEHTNLERSFRAFEHILKYWQMANDYYP